MSNFVTCNDASARNSYFRANVTGNDVVITRDDLDLDAICLDRADHAGDHIALVHGVEDGRGRVVTQLLDPQADALLLDIHV